MQLRTPKEITILKTSKHVSKKPGVAYPTLSGVWKMKRPVGMAMRKAATEPRRCVSRQPTVSSDHWKSGPTTMFLQHTVSSCWQWKKGREGEKEKSSSSART